MAKSHYAGLFIYQEGEEGFEYLVVEYDSGDGKQIKVPGGTNNDHPGEPLFGKDGTLCREGKVETGLIVPSDLTDSDIVFVDPKRDHDKIFVAVPFERCLGKLRTTELNDEGDLLSPPFWRTARELLVRVEDGGLFWTHREALKATEERLTKKAHA